MKLIKYWPEILTFGGIFGLFLILNLPDITWLNTDADGPHYIYSAKYLYPAHKTSAPLFLLLGHLFLKIPYGTDAWRMGLISVFASTASAGFIYLIVRHYVQTRWYGLLAGLIFAASALVISQSTIIETYALVTMFGLAGFYFCIRKQWLYAALALGAGGAVHHLIGIPLIVLLLSHRELRQWRYIGVMACFLLFYLYIPITNREPYMWISGDNQTTNFLVDNLSTALMLIGGLSIWDFPKRLLDTVGLVGVSLGLALIPLSWYFWKCGKQRVLKQPLFWLFILPIVYYMTDLAPQTYVYALPGIAFGTVIAGIGLGKMRMRFSYLIAMGSVVMLGWNLWYFDIGNSLDPDMSARQYYDNELPKVPDGEILITQQGWEWAIVYLYNKEEGKNILPVSAGTLPSLDYQEQLKKQGILLRDNSEDALRVKSTNIALSIIELNENVWTTRTAGASTYGAEIVPAKENTNELWNIPKTVTDGSMDMQWRWRPSNPYDIITGAIEVDEWIWIVFSNYTILTFTMLGAIGGVPVWIGHELLVKRRKWNWRNVVGQEIES